MSISNGSAAEIEFDLANFKVRDLRDLSRAQREGDVDAQLAIYAKFIVSCPKAWGDPKDPDTILDLNYKAVRQISEAMNEAIKADSKK